MKCTTWLFPDLLLWNNWIVEEPPVFLLAKQSIRQNHLAAVRFLQVCSGIIACGKWERERESVEVMWWVLECREISEWRCCALFSNMPGSHYRRLSERAYSGGRTPCVYVVKASGCISISCLHSKCRPVHIKAVICKCFRFHQIYFHWMHFDNYGNYHSYQWGFFVVVV